MKFLWENKFLFEKDQQTTRLLELLGAANKYFEIHLVWQHMVGPILPGPAGPSFLSPGCDWDTVRQGKARSGNWNRESDNHQVLLSLLLLIFLCIKNDLYQGLWTFHSLYQGLSLKVNIDRQNNSISCPHHHLLATPSSSPVCQEGQPWPGGENLVYISISDNCSMSGSSNSCARSGKAWN